jgi:type VI secretion system protein ImpE
MSLEAAERTLREGDVTEALRSLQDQVRKDPANGEARVFLFQLLSLVGLWDRALTQLNVAAELDAKALAMAQMYRAALQCEVLRVDVFAGKKSPVVFGEPDQWLALLIESMLVAGRQQPVEAQHLREQAFEAAPQSAGSLDGARFAWIADADMRLGPVCEAIVNGRYYWLPFARLARIDLEEPTDLRDLVWMPAHFQFANGGEAVGLIPTRYPGSETSNDSQVCLARKTTWKETAPDVFEGLGQRVIATDAGEFPLMDVRNIVIGVESGNASGTAHA